MAIPDHQHWLAATASTESSLELLQHQYAGYCHALAPFLADATKKPVTLYEFLATRPDTSLFFQLVDQSHQIKHLLQDSAFSSTVWAPSNTALQPLCNEMSQEDILSWLQAHISPSFLPICFLLTAPTAETLFRPVHLNGAQRVMLRPSLMGLRVNSHATVIGPDHLVANGLVHIIDRVLLPRPAIHSLIDALPSRDFDLFQTAVQQSETIQAILQDQSRRGGIVFIPTNQAFRRLPEDIQTFLFSDDGAASLQALLRYHTVPNQSLYSNHFYDLNPAPEHFVQMPETTPDHTIPTPDTQADRQWQVLKGVRRFSLPTCLEGLPVYVTVTRYGGLISMKVNQTANVTVQDGLASDGVCHIVDSLLFPPQQNEKDASTEEEGKPRPVLSVEDAMARLGQLNLS
ncbi:FAS1 domain-containing protein [Aspergillus sclerotioniger CBS 115572]|uniref:FAS1 domain-containing protein n=1 Tax=Aspergillus sclerotioniger CBS 115572 TaxID=1450535 RepID=A0A317XCY2_9EURO|nr:FAS1 domain-containing protein [Aspergillus sclerotioniger CBS 115572]PWY94808.1 FAS1 domain-containing protein [Aspergillus sclerotioniger CBS 115572]